MPLPRPLVRAWRPLRRWLPPCNFITIHYAYFVVTCLIAAVVFWGASTPAKSVRFIDALFVIVSAMTLSGLSTINLSTINTFQQVLVFLVIMAGSAIFVSAFVVHLRKRAFEKKFQIIVERERHKDGTKRRTTSLHTPSVHELHDTRRPSILSVRYGLSHPAENHQQHATDLAHGSSTERSAKDNARVESAIADDEGDHATYPSHLTFSRDTRFRAGSISPHSHRRRYRLSFNMQGVGAVPSASLDVANADAIEPMRSRSRSEGPTDTKKDPQRYFDATEGWVSRNSQFHGLTERERERLGGYEYRAVTLLSWIVPAYYIAFQLLGCLGCAAWVAYNRPDTAQSNGINPWWLGAFNAVSAFSE